MFWMCLPGGAGEVGKRGNMMVKTMMLLGWVAVTGIVFYAMFAPGAGLLEAGPGACVGLSLLGAAAMRHAQQSEAIGEDAESR